MTPLIAFGIFLVVFGVVQTFRVVVGRLRDDYYQEVVRRILLQKTLRDACNYLESAADVIQSEGLDDDEEDSNVRVRLKEWRIMAGGV